MNFLQLAASVPDEQRAIAFLRREHILHQRRRRSNGHAMYISLAGNRGRLRCTRRTCREELDV
jgi:hypothetical protein